VTLLEGSMAKRFSRAQERKDDGAIIAAWAAIQFQDQPKHFRDAQYQQRICLEAWSDAINGGIILC
jgi:hypothetical protein